MGAFISLLPNLFHYIFGWNGAIEVPPNKKVVRLHVKCRNANPKDDNFLYQSNCDGVKGAKVVRTYIPDEKVSWSSKWPEYAPVEYTDPKVIAKPVWADPEDRTTLKWNQVDNGIDRRSHMGNYAFDSLNRPLNPVGRTGISGRGQLGKWGPNHAADPIVTRWKVVNGEVVKNEKTGKPILEFASIQRKDVGQWAIPGGMVDPGEKVSITVKREFMEEATNALEKTPEEQERISKQLDKLFTQGTEVYRGYVDDPRNTDNAWMETTAFNFHDENNQVLKEIKLEAGDDAGAIQWIAIDRNLKLYASHKDFIEQSVKLLNAHW